MSERFYNPLAATAGDRVELDPEESHHLAHVRRIGVGETVELFDGQAGVWRGEVLRIGKRAVELRLLQRLDARPAPPLEITLATAVPKGDRFDWLIEKCTELGVARLVPLRCERSVVDPRSSRLERLRRRVIEACKQCRRDRLMTIEDPVGFPEYLGSESVARRVVAHPGGPLPWEWAMSSPGEAISLLIGPEGGLTPDEVDSARGAGWEPVGLGQTILRIETAGVAAAAFALARMVPPGDPAP